MPYLLTLLLVLAVNTAWAGPDAHGISPGPLMETRSGDEAAAAAPAAVSVLSGLVVEKGTKTPLRRKRIYIKQAEKGKLAATLFTDDQGRFSRSLPPGTYEVIVALPGYDKLTHTVDVYEGLSVALTLRVVPQALNPYRVVVRKEKARSDVSLHHITVQEITAIPGSNRDVLQSVTNMPGVNSVSVFNGYGNGIVIRGSSQEDSLLMINDHTIPAFYHFEGLESIIEPEMIESVDYHAGGFSPEFGNAMGGVIDMKIRHPRTDRMGGYVNVGLLSSSFMVEGPLSHRDAIAFGMKRGFLDQYMRIADQVDEERNEDNTGDFVKYPVYYDGSFLFTRKASPENMFRLIGIGASDAFKYTDPEDPVAERYANTLKHTAGFLTLIGEWQYKDKTMESVFSPMVNTTRLTWDQGEETYHRQTVREAAFSEKIAYTLDHHHRLKGGLRLEYAHVNLDSRSMILEKEGEVASDRTDLILRQDKRYDFFIPYAHVMDEMTFGPWRVTPGVHVMQDTYNHHTLADPRLSVKYRLNDKMVIKTALGRYSQMPQYDEFIEPWGTRGLKPERSVHTVAGIEHHFTPDIMLDIQAYYKSFDDLVVRDVAEDPTAYTNDGSGHAYGTELILRHRMTDRFFGWIAYAWSVAERRDGPGRPIRFFDNDPPHNLTAVFSYKFDRGVSVGCKYQFASGTPIRT